MPPFNRARAADAARLLAKFRAIPPERWTTGKIRDTVVRDETGILQPYERYNRYCVLGHCGVGGSGLDTKESIDLRLVLSEHKPLKVVPVSVNDNHRESCALDGLVFPKYVIGPRARILYTLRKIEKQLRRAT